MNIQETLSRESEQAVDLVYTKAIDSLNEFGKQLLPNMYSIWNPDLPNVIGEMIMRVYGSGWTTTKVEVPFHPKTNYSYRLGSNLTILSNDKRKTRYKARSRSVLDIHKSTAFHGIDKCILPFLPKDGRQEFLSNILFFRDKIYKGMRPKWFPVNMYIPTNNYERVLCPKRNTLFIHNNDEYAIRYIKNNEKMQHITSMLVVPPTYCPFWVNPENYQTQNDINRSIYTYDLWSGPSFRRPRYGETQSLHEVNSPLNCLTIYLVHENCIFDIIQISPNGKTYSYKSLIIKNSVNGLTTPHDQIYLDGNVMAVTNNWSIDKIEIDKNVIHDFHNQNQYITSYKEIFENDSVIQYLKDYNIFIENTMKTWAYLRDKYTYLAIANAKGEW